MPYTELDYEAFDHRRIEHEHRNNLLAEQRAIIEMAEIAKHKSSTPVVHVVNVKTENPVNFRIERDNRRLESSLGYANARANVLADTIDDQKIEIQNKNELISDQRDTIQEQRDIIQEQQATISHLEQMVIGYQKLLEQCSARCQDAEKLAHEAKMALYDYKREVKLKGLSTCPPVVKTFSKSNNTLFNSTPSDPHSALNRWIMEKSVQQSRKSNRQEIYTPTQNDLNSISFMVQHNIVRMDSYEIPSLQRHQENTFEWNNMV